MARLQVTSLAMTHRYKLSCLTLFIGLQRRLKDLTAEILFLENSNGSLDENPVAFRTRCGGLQNTLMDILDWSHRIAVAGLPCCPETPASRPRKLRQTPPPPHTHTSPSVF